MPKGCFKRLEAKFARKPGIYDPAALAAKVSREKEGKRKFQAKAARGRRKG
jgi:hypothetical protein